MLYLFDTCAYLRLALNIHPLLGSTYYKTPEIGQVTSEVHTEWEKQPRLQTKFHWAGDAIYVGNRIANLVILTGSQLTAIWKSRQFIQSHALSVARALKADGCTIPSTTDCAVLAYTLVLNEQSINATAVSDDQGMLWVARDLQIPAITSLQMVHTMVLAGTRTVANIQALAAYLDYEKDLPPDWRASGLSLFGVNLP